MIKKIFLGSDTKQDIGVVKEIAFARILSVTYTYPRQTFLVKLPKETITIKRFF